MTIHLELARPPQTSCSPCESSYRPKIAIVGGGFSGTVVLANLVANAPAHSIEIDMFETRDDCGPGLAYGTCERVHLLNVQAARMGAVAPEDFLRWSQSESGIEACRQLGSSIEAGDYAPRALYGRYIQDFLAETLATAWRRGIRVRLVQEDVTDITPRRDGRMMISSGGRRSEADAVVLATGNFPPRPLLALSRAAERSRRYIGDLWGKRSAFAYQIGGLSSADTVLILGTGLTAIDAILSLQARGFRGKIVAISRHGRLPLAHKPGVRLAWTLTVRPDDVEPTARALMAWLRREAKLADAEGVGWRSVFDAVRPLTQSLWRTLETRERAKLLRRLSLWNIHRHRMAPDAHVGIEMLRETGQLDVFAARCLSVQRRLGGFSVQLRRKLAAASETIKPALIVNCTNPEYDIARIDHPLFKNLLKRRLVVRSPVGGIAVRDNATAEGRNDGRIFAIGPLLIGELLETTAVPELRELAKHVAVRVHARLGHHARISL